MPKSFYHFNPKTLTYEKVKVSFKHLFKRLVWVFASGVAFALVFVWIAFYVIDSPKVKILERENNELKEEVDYLTARLDVLSEVLADIEDRDDNIYRNVFEADPVPASERYPLLVEDTRFDSLSRSEANTLLKAANKKADQLTVRMAVQTRSLDTLERIANSKAEMLAAIPAIRPLKNMYTITSGFGKRYHPVLKTLRNHTGIDIAAHRAALKHGVPTVAVLPRGLNHIYPSMHRPDAVAIAKHGGMLLTDYTSQDEVQKSNFLARNRIVAALSDRICITR